MLARSHLQSAEFHSSVPAAMKIFAVTLVRSEADIIAVTIRYHLQLGLDGLFVLDDASSDGTDKILERLAQGDDRIRWSRHEGEYQQAELTTGLAQEALRAGADWIVPFDAEEFGHAPAGLTDQEPSKTQADRAAWQREIVQNFLTNLHDDALSRTEWAVGLDE